MIKCAYQTPREICYAVNDCVGNLNLTPRPWIFQEPNTWERRFKTPPFVPVETPS